MNSLGVTMDRVRFAIKARSLLAAVAAAMLLFCGNAMEVVAAQTAAPASSSAIPADPWPRDISLSNAALLVYQPQVSKWEDNRIEFRSALAIKPTGAKNETFGSVFATARTQVDKV